jgi:hypothetical protein
MLMLSCAAPPSVPSVDLQGKCCLPTPRIQQSDVCLVGCGSLQQLRTIGAISRIGHLLERKTNKYSYSQIK